MKAIIYALVDPNTHQVRYVGRTNQTAVQRLGHHLGVARRGSPRVVYDWIRSLLPEQPLLVILEEGIKVLTMGSNHKWSTDHAAETKWMKRFERSQLLCEIPRHSQTYKSLVNPPGVKACKRRR
jgi:hypothetical protein